MKRILIPIVLFMIIVPISCKKTQPAEVLPDDGPFTITKMLPLSDDVTFQLLGSGKILFERKFTTDLSAFYIIDADKKKSSGFILNSRITQPNIAPDGNKIACTLLNSSDLKANWNIYVMNLDGTGCMPVSSAEKNANYPIWTNDGSKILYYTSDPDGKLFMQSPVENSTDKAELVAFHSSADPDWFITPTSGFIYTTEGYLVGVSNSGKLCGVIGIKPFLGKEGVSVLMLPQKNIEYDSFFRVESPVLSSDGSKIAFALVYFNQSDPWIGISLYTMNPDGTKLMSVGGISGYKPNDNRTRYVSICWSPDQTKILFTRPVTESTSNIFVCKLDGSGFFQVTNQTNVTDANVSWAK